MTELPDGEGFRKPRPKRVREKAAALKSNNRKVERIALGPEAIAKLQEERYAMWPVEVQQFARAQDARFPLWSCTHRWRPATREELETTTGTNMTGTQEMQWSYDWSSAAAIYVGGDLGLRELSAGSGIHERRMFWASSRYGWAQQKATHDILREQEESSLSITQVAEAARESAIRDTFTKVGLNLLQHCMAALNREAANIEPRDIAPLMDKAIRLIGAGEKMPTEYRHSVVDNPSANPMGNTTLVTGAVILSRGAASGELERLAERLEVLRQARPAIPAIPAEARPV